MMRYIAPITKGNLSNNQGTSGCWWCHLTSKHPLKKIILQPMSRITSSSFLQATFKQAKSNEAPISTLNPSKYQNIPQNKNTLPCKPNSPNVDNNYNPSYARANPLSKNLFHASREVKKMTLYNILLYVVHSTYSLSKS